MAAGSSVSLSVWNGLDLQTLSIFALIFLVIADFMKNRRHKPFPPTPPGLPFLGNIFTISFKKAHINLTQLAVHHGDVYSLRMGQKWMVILNGYKTVKEVLITQGDGIAARPYSELTASVSQEFGLVMSNGYLWKEQRRFALSTLKHFGVGKNSLESAIINEFSHQSRDVSNMNGKPFDPHRIINRGVANIISTLVFGHRFEDTDLIFQSRMELLEEAMELERSIWAQLFHSFFGLMKMLPGPHRKLQTNWEILKDFMKTEIEQHKLDRDPEEPRDYIDYYLNEIEKNKADEAAGFCEEDLVICALDLFAAGTETTSTTLRWGLLYMTKYPEVQEKVQAEIDSVIGQSRTLSMADRVHLPYTDAVLHEIQRFGNIAPLGVPRMATRDIQIGELIIPKGTDIIVNLTSVMFDRNEWETPDSFNPQHFLDKDGKFIKKAAFLPFSAGKRVCLGENLAKMELFLFFTSFLQKFTFSLPAGVKPSMQYRLGITLTPEPYQICATPRQPQHH